MWMMGRVPHWALLACAALALAACQSVTAVQRDGTFTLQVGDRARVSNGDFVVRFISVSGDSRCPVDVQCVWAGDAVVSLDLVSSGRTRSVDLHTNSTSGTVSTAYDGQVVELLELTPAPHSKQALGQGDYTARLRISHI